MTVASESLTSATVMPGTPAAPAGSEPLTVPLTDVAANTGVTVATGSTSASSTSMAEAILTNLLLGICALSLLGCVYLECVSWGTSLAARPVLRTPAHQDSLLNRSTRVTRSLRGFVQSSEWNHALALLGPLHSHPLPLGSPPMRSSSRGAPRRRRCGHARCGST